MEYIHQRKSLKHKHFIHTYSLQWSSCSEYAIIWSRPSVLCSVQSYMCLHDWNLILPIPVDGSRVHIDNFVFLCSLVELVFLSRLAWLGVASVMELVLYLAHYVEALSLNFHHQIQTRGPKWQKPKSSTFSPLTGPLNSLNTEGASRCESASMTVKGSNWKNLTLQYQVNLILIGALLDSHASRYYLWKKTY